MDDDLHKVAVFVERHLGLFPEVIRDSIDQLLDGRHSGRWAWDSLFKTEKTHMGSVIEINLRRRIPGLGDGLVMDWQVDGVEFDCKFSQSPYGWMIPIEAMGHICLLLHASDENEIWSAGVVRITDEILTRGGNRDGKRSMSSAGRPAITWLAERAALPENLLAHLNKADRDGIFAPRSGQERINELFRRVQRRIVRRAVVETVAQQADSMKRPRDARKQLRKEGIVILGHQEQHPDIARALRLPVARKGEFIAARLAPGSRATAGSAELRGTWWKLAAPEDPAYEVPLLNEKNPKDK
jgi:hypothetical protein